MSFSLNFCILLTINLLLVNSAVIKEGKDTTILHPELGPSTLVKPTPEITEVAEKKIAESEPADPLPEIELDLDERINLNFQNAHANAFGPGGMSHSNANSHTINVGIMNRYRPNSYHSLINQARGQSHGFATGPMAPHTYANTFSRNRGPGFANSGFRGGMGNAHSQSFNNHMEIPIDPFGTVLLSNFKEDPPKKSTGAATATDAVDDKVKDVSTTNTDNKDPVISPKLPVVDVIQEPALESAESKDK